MIDENEQSRILEEELALVRRCRAFILGSPGSPGGGPMDVIYLTPDGRWLRICESTLNEGRPSPGPQTSTWMSSGEAARIFELYGWPMPAELQDNFARDLEVDGGRIFHEYLEYCGELEPEYVELLDDLEARGDGLTREEQQQKEVLLQKRAMILAGACRGPRLSLEEFCQESNAREVIPRNSLLARLREWSAEWPEPPSKIAASLRNCEKHILQVLLEINHRIKRDELLDIICGKYGDGESTVRNYLAQLGRRGLLDNSRLEKPPGYGLTDEGRRVASSL